MNGITNLEKGNIAIEDYSKTLSDMESGTSKSFSITNISKEGYVPLLAFFSRCESSSLIIAPFPCMAVTNGSVTGLYVRNTSSVTVTSPKVHVIVLFSKAS